MQKLLVILVLVLTVACKKSDKELEPTVPKFVEIRYEKYPVVAIGKLLWTTIDYRDHTGTKPEGYIGDSKMFTIAAAKAIPVPAGWRIANWDDWHALYYELGQFENGMVKGKWHDSTAVDKFGIALVPSLLQEDGAYVARFLGLGKDKEWGYLYLINQPGKGTLTTRPYNSNGPYDNNLYFSLRFVKDK